MASERSHPNSSEPLTNVDTIILKWVSRKIEIPNIELTLVAFCNDIISLLNPKNTTQCSRNFITSARS